MNHRSLAQRLRQHHAVEHATLTLLSRRFRDLQLMARSDLKGFVVYGNVDTSSLKEMAQEGLARLKAGESRLAVHENCGTNLVAAGTLSALAALATTLGGKRSWWERLPGAILGATAALLVAAPVGHWLQKKVTTSAEVDGLNIASVGKMGNGNGTGMRHRVTISD